MITSQWSRESLASIAWQEGRVVPLLEGPYRHRVVVCCSKSAGSRQKAMFANGEFPYFCYMELFNTSGQWIREGAGVVPVLPDGRLLMVVEQRPAQSRYFDRPSAYMLRIGGREVDLRRFGPYSSVEFPGGGVDPLNSQLTVRAVQEAIRLGGLSELAQETGVATQDVFYWSCERPVYPFGSDLALRQFLAVAYLTSMQYEDEVANDGGLKVLALTENEVQEGIWSGVISAGQAAILQWGFYQEVKAARNDLALAARMEKAGYLKHDKIKLAKAS